MFKKLFSIIFIILIISLTAVFPLTASAYEITGFDISAKEGMLVSLDTGEILYQKNIDTKLYPASITKIMTVILILENEKYNATEKITMTKSVEDLISGTGSSVSNLKIGEELTQLDLVYLILMASYGDCAYLGAEYFGGSVENFVLMMNKKAAELKLKNTHYTNPVGLHDPDNYTTVSDIHTLASYALKNETFKTVCSTPKYEMPATNMSKKRTLSTTNYLQDTSTNYYYQYAHGVKTGYTDEAGRCLVSTASYKGYNYMCILMGCPPKADRRYEFLESGNLYRWAFNNFSFKEVASSKEPVCEIPVELSLETDFVPLYFEKPHLTILPNEADDSTIVVKTHLSEKSVKAPIKKGDILGTADIVYAEQVVATVNLVAGKYVKQSLILKTFSSIKRFFSSMYMKILIILVLIILLVFLILCIRLNISRLKRRRVKYIPYGKSKGNDNYDN